MKLISIQVFAIGSNGLSSNVLEFGRDITQLYGPNGCGKTPLIQSIPFCLGFPTTFRNDIYERCSHVVLKVSIDGNPLSIKRIYSRDVDIEVTEKNNIKQRFYNEQDYSEYLFGLLDIDFPYLVGNNNQATKPYLSTLLPIFYTDQDEGYSNIYYSQANFIKDQFSEMIRLLLRLPAKNYFEKKKKMISAKERLSDLDRRIEVHSRKLESTKEACKDINKNSSEIENEISQLTSEFEGLKQAGSSEDEALNILERMISKKISEVRKIENSIIELKNRTKSTSKIVHEINTEIETLNLNEEARRVFLSIDEICGSTNCQLFSPSSASYSKNLLYLKDQIKDLERNSVSDQLRVSELQKRKDDIENEIQELSSERNKTIEQGYTTALVDAISEIKYSIFELQNKLGDVIDLEKTEKNHFKLLLERKTAYENVQSLSTGRVNIPELARLKANLRELYLIWLEKIHTSNISRDITFKDDFVPILGKENIKQLKGSTRSRAILAYHAALLQLLTENKASGFKFLILDTPKQHETHVHDLDRFIKALKDLCENLGIQIVFSTTEYRYLGDEMDKEWNPTYPGAEQNMFLRAESS
ncbi:AAA family ATPase [Methylophaga sulfidovorans]|uniref:AAA domain-containing protein n=1 Tax=Methylophaga sulfidovorans TaxID=45496 RepID=A0A1I3UP91_9GAMM|nr:AAA family ATPase [Methylophaga sulfidovorans]SFJ83681.1 AAA domain-containing protein [Methylophaga sulfidovorans]